MEGVLLMIMNDGMNEDMSHYICHVVLLLSFIQRKLKR